jgi:hypothetical protein
MVMKMSSTWLDLKTTWNSFPAYVRTYLGLYFFILFLLMFWVPGNDFDTMSSYIARIKLEEFGDLHQTATFELQYLFPKFFDYLHKPFLELSYFTTFPNFALALVALLVLALTMNFKERKIALAFVMACPPILLAMTSLKNDLALGCFAVLAWYCIFIRPNSVTYLAFSLLALCALVGTKWHGLFIVLPLGVGLVFQLIRTRRPDIKAIAVALLMSPSYWLVSSAGVYFDNLSRYGSPTPVPTYLRGQMVPLSHLPLNIYQFMSSTFMDTFDIPLYLIDSHLQWKIWSYLEEITAGGRGHGYAFVVNSCVGGFGILLLFVLGSAVHSLVRRKDPLAVRAAAATALCYTILVLASIEYSSWINRYFLPSFMLGLIPAVRLVERLKLPRFAVPFIITYAFVMSLQALLLNQEKFLVPVTNYTLDGFHYKYPAIYHDLLKRDRLYFNVWSGYVHIYEELSKEVQPSDGLIVYNPSVGGENPPFLYPLIKDRSPANTRVINVRNGGQWDASLCPDFRYVLVYKGRLDDPHYEEVYSYDGDREMNLYRRVREGCV